MKKILMVGAEAMPFASSGGLGDVLGSLPREIQAAAKGEADVRVVLPLYGSSSAEHKKMMVNEAEFSVDLSWRKQYCGVKSLELSGVKYYFIDNEYYFKRENRYGNFDDGERFAFFCKAVLAMADTVDFIPDILHAHDWQAALSVVYLKTKYRNDPKFRDILSVFTIHNIEYQGKYSHAILGDVFELSQWEKPLVDYSGCINLMKGAIALADKVTTVSPRYAEEIKSPEYAHGLEFILRLNEYKLSGILNGIDYSAYDPETDKNIKSNFSAQAPAGKYANKTALQEELALPVRDVPMVCAVTRLVGHKGFDLMRDTLYPLLYERDIQFVILGTGDGHIENFFRSLEGNFRDKARSLIKYDRALAARVYAACDIFLMPSKSEPCGLSQMIASRYGAFPVTRETGGLYDSIKGYYEKDGKIFGNGFTFANYNPQEFAERTRAAIDLWCDEKKRKRLVRKIMKTDFSWKTSAEKYLELYQILT